MKYVLNETDLLRCLGRLFVPADGEPHHLEFKWKAVNNELVVTVEVGPPIEDGKPPMVVGPDLVESLKPNEVRDEQTTTDYEPI